MKSVIISIQPKWAEKIATGEKTIEVRKSRPKIETPFKCYIYCTKHKERLIDVIKKGDDIGWGCTYKENTPMFIKTFADTALLGTNWVGKVIGEFVCDRIGEIYQCNSGWVKENACISKDEFFDYLGIPRGTHFGYDKKAYAWHISDLKIYDKPKELSEFKNLKGESIKNVHQSWVYIKC